jgi:extradiol dioxygenase family protein
VRVFLRCERELRESLCADNCLAMLLHLKPCAAEVPELVDAAHAVAAEHVAVVLRQPEWKEFSEEYPKAAVAIMEDIALKLASVNAEQALDAPGKRPRAS